MLKHCADEVSDIDWHCLNHELELSLSDPVKYCAQSSHLAAFLDKLYFLYNQSSKNLRELDAEVSEGGLCLRGIAQVVGMSWVAPSFRIVKAVWRMYAALYSHTAAASKDDN